MNPLIPKSIQPNKDNDYHIRTSAMSEEEKKKLSESQALNESSDGDSGNEVEYFTD